jgi:hypothetical protein
MKFPYPIVLEPRYQLERVERPERRLLAEPGAQPVHDLEDRWKSAGRRMHKDIQAPVCVRVCVVCVCVCVCVVGWQGAREQQRAR